jgi:predicted FMN-binding regulatory protein PaiB
MSEIHIFPEWYQKPDEWLKNVPLWLYELPERLLRAIGERRGGLFR